MSPKRPWLKQNRSSCFFHLEVWTVQGWSYSSIIFREVCFWKFHFSAILIRCFYLTIGDNSMILPMFGSKKRVEKMESASSSFCTPQRHTAPPSGQIIVMGSCLAPTKMLKLIIPREKTWCFGQQARLCFIPWTFPLVLFLASPLTGCIHLTCLCSSCLAPK